MPAALALVAETAVERILEFGTEAGARGHRHRFDPDHVGRGPRRGARRRDAAARIHGEPRPPCQEHGHFRAPDRARDARGRDRGPARARAHGRHGALLRERFGQPLPRDPRGQEPLRRGQRDRRVRDGGARPAGGPQSIRDLPVPRQRSRARLGRDGRARGHAADADRGAGARRCEPARESAPRRRRLRGEPGRAAARRAAPPRGRRARTRTTCS